MSGEVKAGYKQTEAGVIPLNWCDKTLKDFISLRRGHDLTASERRPGSVPVMGSAGQNGFHDVALANGPGITLGRSGASYGQAHFCPVDFWPHNTALYVTDFKGNDPLFVFYFLRGTDFSAHNTGGAQQSLNRNFIYPLPVAYPSLEEQREIALVLSDMDTLITGLDQLISKKHDIQQAAMQQLLSGQRRLPGFSGAWAVKKLGDAAALHRMNIVPRTNPDRVFTHFSLPAFDDGALPVCEPGFMIGSNKFSVPQDAILISKLNPRIPRIWKPITIPENSVASTEFLILTPKEGVSRDYLYVASKSPAFCGQMEQAATGTTGSHQRISPSHALELTLTIPVDATEQAAIASALSDVDAELTALEARRDKARQLKQGMMQELLTGRIRLV